ncbi:hypothetical protein BH09VER1_BH09VER1_06100 [soil metagenome]
MLKSLSFAALALCLLPWSSRAQAEPATTTFYSSPRGVGGSYETYGDQKIGIPFSDMQPLYYDGSLVGVNYKGASKGSASVDIWRPKSGGAYTFVSSVEIPELTLGDAYAPAPAPIEVKAGDVLVARPITGRFASRSWGAQMSADWSGPYDHAGTTPVWNLPRQPAIQGVLTRRVSPQELAREASYGTTPIVNECFLGGALPATWFSDGMPGISVNNGLILQSAQANWRNHAVYNSYSNAQRKSFGARLTFTDANSMAGICSSPQDGSTVPNCGCVAVLDATAGPDQAVFKAYGWSDQGPEAPKLAPITVPFPIPVVAGRSYLISAQFRSGLARYTCTDTVKQVSVSLDCQYGTASFAGLGWGRPGVICPIGRVSCPNFFFNIDCKAGQLLSIFGDSILDKEPNIGVQYDRVASSLLIADPNIAGPVLNCSRAGADSDEAALCLATDLLKVPPVYALYALGANDVKRGPYTTDEAVAAQWKANALDFARKCQSVGTIPLFQTMTPYNGKLSINALINAIVRDKTQLPYWHADLDVALAAEPDGVWNPGSLTYDTLHGSTYGMDLQFKTYRAAFPFLFNPPFPK